MNDNELRYALHEYANNVRTGPDGDAVAAAFTRIDRVRLGLRLAVTGGVASVAAAGLVLSGAGGGPSPQPVAVEPPTPVETTVAFDLAPIDEPPPTSEKKRSKKQKPVVAPAGAEEETEDEQVEDKPGPELEEREPKPPSETEQPEPEPAEPKPEPPAEPKPDVEEPEPKPEPEPVPPVTEKPKPEPEEPKPEEPVEVAFTAHAKYGSCDAEVPYDKYWGTAAPHSEIIVTSPFSEPVVIEVGASGEWYQKIWFPEAPLGEPFEVRFQSAQGVIELGFVRTG